MVCGLLCCLPVWAATVVFTSGDGDGLWGMAANWSTAAVPGIADNAVVNLGRVATIAENAAATDRITVGNGPVTGTVLYIAADIATNWFRVALAADSLGAVTQTAGTVQINSGFEIGPRDTAAGQGIYRLQGGSLQFPALTLGAAGAGHLVVAAPQASSIQGQSLRLGSEATLLFELTMLGVAPVDLSGALTIETGSQLVVDGTDYEALDGYFPLILSPAVAGAFAAEDVSFVGLAGREPALVLQTDGLWLRLLAPPALSQELCSLTPESTVATDYGNTTFSASRALEVSGSAWSLSLHEAHVMDARLTQTVVGGGPGEAQRSWDLRVGRGGHLYSLRTPVLGETVPPQWRSDGDSSPWNDEVWQGVAVDSAQNAPPDSPYFIHQAGVYTKRDPMLSEPFYSPQVAAWLNPADRSYTTVNWGQQAHIGIYGDATTENDWKSHMLFFTRYRDLGQGVIEVSLGVYSYGPDTLAWLNMPWGGVRRTSTEYAFLSEPGGTSWSEPATHGFGSGASVELNKTGGWAGFSNSNTGAAPALGIVFGLDSDPLPDPSVGASWYRWGYAGGSFSAEETTWRNYFVSSNVRRYRVGQGEGVWSRYYFVLGGDLTDLAARIAARSLVGVELREFDYDESSSPLVGYRSSGSGADFRIAVDNESPHFQLYAHPVRRSFPIYEVLERDGRRFLSWSPYATGMVKTYDGQLAGIRLLGFALPETATNQAGTVYAYESLATTLARAAGNYLPAGENLVARALECDNGSEPTRYFADADRDGFGDAASSLVACSAPPGYVGNDDDWDDTQAGQNPDVPGTLIRDDFSESSISYDFVRVRQGDIDQGWQANSNLQVGQGFPQSGWTISGGALHNDQITDDSAGEGAVAQVISVSEEGPELVLSFDYINSGNDTLYVHLWGFTGQFEPDEDNLANPQASNGTYHNLAEDVDGDGQVNTYNLKDGANSATGTPAHALAALTGSGRYTRRIPILDLGITGVRRLEDFSYLSVAFTRNLGSSPGPTSIARLQLSAAEDPPDGERHKRHYSYLYFENGYPTRFSGRRPQSEANLAARANPDLVVQTGYYSLMLDCNDMLLTGYDALVGSDYVSALEDDVSTFTAAQNLVLRAYHNEVAYDCTSAVVQAPGQDNIRLIESGQYVQRIDHLGLVFTAANGDVLPVAGRFELTAWPDRVTLLLDFRDAEGVTRTTIQLISPAGVEHLGDTQADHVMLTLCPHEDRALAALTADDYISTAQNLHDGSALSYRFDEEVHALHIDVPAEPVVHADSGQRVDEYLIEVTNPTSEPCNLPLVFDQVRPRAITGTSMHLVDPSDSRPLGIPVQISKNWHRGDTPTPHDGPWLHGSTMLSLAPGMTRQFTLRVVYGYWGDVAAVSHAQLSLIGWGGNWKWDESALGAWGESMTYDPSQHLGSAFIDDVRPTFTPSLSGGTHSWTENVGGGDFLVYRDGTNAFRWGTRLKTAYDWTGPNMTRVLYSGVTDDGKIRFTYTTRMVRTNDYHRRFHRYRYEFLKDVTTPQRLVFHQLAADYYTGPSFTEYYHGAGGEAATQWQAEPGGNSYNGAPLPFDDHWLAIDDQLAGAEPAHARRGILSLGTTLNGAALDTYLHRYGRSWGDPRLLFDLGAASPQQSFASGDVVEGELALIFPAKTAAGYWGADAQFAARLASYGDNPWQAVADEFVYNQQLSATVHQGTLLGHYPLDTQADRDAAVWLDLTIDSGGIGHVPLILRGVPPDVGVALQRRVGEAWQPEPETAWPQSAARADGDLDWIFTVSRLDTEPTAPLRLRAVRADQSQVVATISYSLETVTNTSVVATLQVDQAVTVTNNGGEFSYTFTEDGSFTFQFTDQYGNADSATALVDWIDQTPPVLSLEPVALELELGAYFHPLSGASALDARDGDLTAQVSVIGVLEPLRLGAQRLTYAVSDSAGNDTTAQRTVTYVQRQPFQLRTPGRHLGLLGDDALMVDWDERLGQPGTSWRVTAVPSAGMLRSQGGSLVSNGTVLSIADFPLTLLEIAGGGFQQLELGLEQTDQGETVYLQLYSNVPWLDLSLARGWNLIAVPFFPFQPLRECLPAALGADDWVGYRNGGFVASNRLQPGDGCWGFLRRPLQARLTGWSATGTRASLECGWNLIGTAGAAGEQLAPGQMAWAYDAGTGQFRAETSELQPGVGYWYYQPDVYQAERRQVEALAGLTAAPTVRASEGDSALRAIYYDGLPWDGTPTRVFGWLGLPQDLTEPVPGIVLVHGGGGTAFVDWVARWTEAGFAALSIAVEGQTDQRAEGGEPATGTGWIRHAWAGPERQGIYHDLEEPIADQWMYHAVADTILANSLLRSQPEVDSEHVGIMGISWGGVITATVMGLDPRFAFAIPVYGCGELATAGNQYGRNLGNNELYQLLWDPRLRLARASMPALWLSWPGDVHFPMDSFSASYRGTAGPHQVSLIPGMGHGHGAGWKPSDSYAFAQSVVATGKPWCQQLAAGVVAGYATASFTSDRAFDRAVLVSTIDVGFTGTRRWLETTAALSQADGQWHASALLPAGTTAWFMNLISGNLTVSSEYQE